MAWDVEIKKSLAYCGENVFIGPGVIFTAPEKVHLESHVRIDPYCVITTGLKTGSCIQICAHAVISGGSDHLVTLGDWSFIGYHSMLFCGSEDYSGKYGVVNDFWGENKVHHGDITFRDYAGVASGCIVMPGVILPEGCTIGAQSFVYNHKELFTWSIWKGNPLKRHGNREKNYGKLKEKWL